MTNEPASSHSSVSSVQSHRSGKSLAEKIRELGFNLRNKRAPRTWDSLQHLDIKTEANVSANILVITPSINLEQIVYYQPEISVDDTVPGNPYYKIEKFKTKSAGPKEIISINDIEVKSYKPSKRMKFRKKKRHSSIISRIQNILNSGKDKLTSRDPSEESLFLEYEENPVPEKEINDLPENLLQKIFFYISQKERCLVLSRVCKTWYFILKDPVFWTELEFAGSNVPSETIIRLIKSYPTVKKLSLLSVPKTVEILQELCRCNHSITHLGVRHCDVSYQDFSRTILHVISCCINLEVLDIKGMQVQSERFYLELGRLKNLKSINLSGNKFLRSQDLITLSVNCRQLEELKILDTAADNNSGTLLTDNNMGFIFSHLEQNLRILKIDMQQLGSISYQAILRCLFLKRLTMKNCLLLTSDMFQQFPLLKHLKKLKVTRAINLNSEDFQNVFQNPALKNIEELDINGCWGVGEAGLRVIAYRLTSLKSLSVKNCKSLKDSNISFLSLCSDLMSLNVAHTYIDCQQLLTLLKHLKNLRVLVVDSSALRKTLPLQLKVMFPNLTLKISYSEFQKYEKVLSEY